MNPDNSDSEYVSRNEEEVIRAELAQVRETRQSRALLIYGPGGVGKTSLVRGMAAAHRGQPHIAWLEPIDVDDPDYWLLANLERKVADELDPDGQIFAPYRRYLSRLPGYAEQGTGRDRVISHLGRIKRVFVECYRTYIQVTGATVVMTFDTVEAMRGIYLLYSLTQWMKSLPGTLFLLSGRPMVQPGDRPDPILDELEDRYQNMPVSTLDLGPFSYEAARDYIRGSAIGGALGGNPDNVDKLVLLTRGHPLWMAFAVAHIADQGMPAEAAGSLADIRRVMPYGADLGRAGQRRYEEFKRSLMVPYQEVDFWHDAINRLAVVRQGMSWPVWERLMSDVPLPAGTETYPDAWRKLQSMPWVRSRANGHYVTLHDAVAEELAQRVIPLHDSDQSWRRQLWRRAAAIYTEIVAEPAAELAAEQAAVDRQFAELAAAITQSSGSFALPSPGQVTTEDEAGHDELIREVVRLDARGRELDVLRVTAFHYQLLSDFAAGTRQFLELFRQAERDSDVFLEDRLSLEMQRFLPGMEFPYPLTDIVSQVVAEFTRWLAGEARYAYLDIGITLSRYLIDNHHPNTAIELVSRLPGDIADSLRRSELEILQANANMRIPGRVADALPCLERALAAAEGVPQTSRRQRAIADVYKELGFFYRNAGQWQEADRAYKRARDEITKNLTSRSDFDREDLASIQSNWAYLKGLIGQYREGSILVKDAIDRRHELGLYLQEGISLSIRGEIFRYERKFDKAWESYARAEQAFQGRRDWSWLGQIYQEQAICLYQATEDNTNLLPDKSQEEQAKRLITLALDICRDQNVRAYPSALNRAGRIFGAEDYQVGLAYLEEASYEASRLSDGWFEFASLIEYVELAYRVWSENRQPELRAAIDGKAAAIRAAISRYHFEDLEGRWLIVAANLAMHDWADTRVDAALYSARRSYTDGFRLLAQSQFGSSGESSIPSRFSQFSSLFATLSAAQQERWLIKLSRSWRNIENGSTTLLACLAQLY